MSESTDNVIGIGQNSPSVVRISSQTPCQSASPMKPVRGVNPPIPSITTSPASREDTRTSEEAPGPCAGGPKGFALGHQGVQ